MVASAAATTTTAISGSGGGGTSASSSSTAARKSRPLRRKTSHSVIERRRREKINEGLVHLQRIVPACRDELRALLLAKAQSDKRLASRLKQQQQQHPQTSPATSAASAAALQQAIHSHVDALLEEKIQGTQMVLEKLCIISHTVDYVEELQQTLKAYQHTYGAPPNSPTTQIPFEKQLKQRKLAHAQAHVDDDEDIDGAVDGEEDQDDEEESAERDDPAFDAEREATLASISSPEQMALNAAAFARNNHLTSTAAAAPFSRAKRQRHWGSNAPLDLSKASGLKRSRSASNAAAYIGTDLPVSRYHDHTDRARPKRRAAPLPHTLREHSHNGSSEESTVTNDDTNKAHVRGAGELDEDEDSENELALDDWHDARVAHHHHHHHHHPMHTAVTQQVPYAVQQQQQQQHAHHHQQQPSYPHTILRRRPSSLYTSKKAEDFDQQQRSGMAYQKNATDCDDCETVMVSGPYAAAKPIVGPALYLGPSAPVPSKRQTSPSDRLLARPHGLDVLAQVSGATSADGASSSFVSKKH